MKITRTGTTSRAYTSPDGSTWTLVPGSTLTAAEPERQPAGRASPSTRTTPVSSARWSSTQWSPHRRPHPTDGRLHGHPGGVRTGAAVAVTPAVAGALLPGLAGGGAADRRACARVIPRPGRLYDAGMRARTAVRPAACRSLSATPRTRRSTRLTRRPFPVPWAGAPNTTFLGGTVPGQTACGTLTVCYDTGAIRLDNPGTAPITVSSVSVDVHSSIPAARCSTTCGVPSRSRPA